MLADMFAQMAPSQGEITLLQWALDKGGAYVVILVVLFFYRRDWQKVSDYKDNQLAILTALVTENTRAQTLVASALRENNIIVHGAKRLLEQQGVAFRRGIEQDSADSAATP